jgi:hypothetical protein
MPAVLRLAELIWRVPPAVEKSSIDPPIRSAE